MSELALYVFGTIAVVYGAGLVLGLAEKLESKLRGKSRALKP